MKPSFALARTTWLELRRERFVWISFAVAGALFLLSLLLGEASLGEKTRVLLHLGISSVQLTLWFLGAFLGAALVSREIERQTCLILLARPLGREAFVFGKIMGLGMLLTQIWVILSAALFVLLWDRLPLVALFQALFVVLLEGITVALVAVCLSMILRSALAGGAAVGVALMGHWVPDFAFFANKASNPVSPLLSQILHYAVPQFHLYNFKSVAWISQGGSWESVAWGAAHMGAWCVVLSLVAGWLFARKDLV